MRKIKRVDFWDTANKAVYVAMFVILVFAFAIALQGPIEERPLGAPEVVSRGVGGLLIPLKNVDLETISKSELVSQLKYIEAKTRLGSTTLKVTYEDGTLETFKFRKGFFTGRVNKVKVHNHYQDELSERTMSPSTWKIKADVLMRETNEGAMYYQVRDSIGVLSFRSPYGLSYEDFWNAVVQGGGSVGGLPDPLKAKFIISRYPFFVEENTVEIVGRGF